MSTAVGQADIQSLLGRGEEFAAKGAVRAAVAFYQAALERAGQLRFLDPDTVSRLRNARAFVQARENDFQRSLDAALDCVDTRDTVGSLRLHHALDMVKGRREIFPQQPSMFYYPYLAQRQVFEREEFDWVPQLEAATGTIRYELEQLLNAGPDFRPYVEDEPTRPFRDFLGLNNSETWTALYIWKHGTLVREVAEQVPLTVKALEKVPLSQIGNWAPSVFYSRLEPGAHIPPHAGMLNSRLICHLPLIVPSGCWLRVGNETREWKEGEVLIFDDSIEHKAKNPSEQLRIVLIFDIWRPELSAAEREGISRMFDAIHSFQELPSA